MSLRDGEPIALGPLAGEHRAVAGGVEARVRDGGERAVLVDRDDGLDGHRLGAGERHGLFEQGGRGVRAPDESRDVDRPAADVVREDADEFVVRGGHADPALAEEALDDSRLGVREAGDGVRVVRVGVANRDVVHGPTRARETT